MEEEYYTFEITIDPCGESSVDYPITDEERKLIDAAIEEGEDFCDCEGLSDLYERVMAAAAEQLQEDVDLVGDDINVDDLHYAVSF